MAYTIMINDVVSGKIWDVTKASSKVIIQQYRRSQASKLTLQLETPITIPKGSKIYFMIDGKSFFKGYYATYERDEWGVGSLTFYDQINYLMKNKTSSTKSETVIETLNRYASEYGLVIGECDPISYRVGWAYNPQYLETLYDTLYYELQQTLYGTNKLYTLLDDAGYLRVISPKRYPAKNIIAAGKNIYSFTYKSSINENTYNRIVLYYDEESSSLVKAGYAEDKLSQIQWGVLSYEEQWDEMAANQQKAENLLKLYNRESIELNIEAVGDPTCRAGGVAYIDIGKVENINLSGLVLLDSVKHTFVEQEHRMTLQTQNITDESIL